jgi:hypothetical protein
MVDIKNEIALMGEALQMQSDAAVPLVGTPPGLTTPPPYVPVTNDPGEAPILAACNQAVSDAVSKYNTAVLDAAKALDTEVSAARTAGCSALEVLVGHELTPTGT